MSKINQTKQCNEHIHMDDNVKKNKEEDENKIQQKKKKLKHGQKKTQDRRDWTLCFFLTLP